MSSCEPVDLLGERASTAGLVVAEVSAHPQPDPTRPTGDSGISKYALVTAMHSSRGPAAARAPGFVCPRVSSNLEDPVDAVDDALDQDAGQMRQQNTATLKVTCP